MHIQSLSSFLILWAGQLISSLGSAMTSFAITIWAFEQTGSALALSFASVAIMVPRMLGGVLAGPIVERLDKKRVLLLTDIGAGVCTLCMMLLYYAGGLALWHIYVLNIITSLLGSFQSPAASVAVSLLVTKAQYTRASGLESFKGGTVQMLSPVLAAFLLGTVGMEGVFAFDLASLLLACLTLGLFVRIPRAEAPVAPLRAGGYFSSLAEGFAMLRQKPLLMAMLGLFAFINMAAGIAYYSLLSPMILARTGSDAQALAFVNGAMGVGALLGGLLVTLLPAARRKVTVVFACCALSFITGDLLFAMGRTPVMWAVAGLLSSLLLPFLDANETYLWRTGIPVAYQGRAFAFKYAFQSGWIPVGILLGGVLADRVLEPYMARGESPFMALVGDGPGSGMALLFLMTGASGVIISVIGLCSRKLRRLEAAQEAAFERKE